MSKNRIGLLASVIAFVSFAFISNNFGELPPYGVVAFGVVTCIGIIGAAFSSADAEPKPHQPEVAGRTVRDVGAHFDRYVGMASAIGFLLIWAIVAWLGVAGPIWRAYWTASASEWLGFAGNLFGGVMTLAVGFAAWIAVRHQINAAQKVATLKEDEAWEVFEADLGLYIPFIDLVWKNVDRAIEAHPDLARKAWRERAAKQSMRMLLTAPQIDALEALTAPLSATKRRQATNVIFNLREIAILASTTIKTINSPAPTSLERMLGSDIGLMHIWLTTFARHLKVLAPKMAEIFANRQHSSIPELQSKERANQLWLNTERDERVKFGE